MEGAFIPVAVFFMVYAALTFELVNKAVAALFGVMVLLALHVISQAIISNIGGTATLIGDPPNIIIGSKVGLTFNQFVINLTLPVMVCFAAALFYRWATNRDKFKPIDTNLAKLFSVQLLLEKIRTNFLDTTIDKLFLTKGLVCLGLASGFLDNIPFTITMIPIVQLMLENNPIPNNIHWWALSLGACLGGNLTMIGASATIASLCHLSHVPIYLFANSLKFSHHPSASQRIHTKTIAKVQQDSNTSLPRILTISWILS